MSDFHVMHGNARGRRKRPDSISAGGARQPARPARRARAGRWGWPAGLLFASGAAGLVYQVLWIKQLALVVGVEVHAVTTAVAAFFAGLALGSWVFGRVADALASRDARPLQLYAVLEFAIAALALAATFALAHAAAPFAWLESRVGLLAWALPFVLVGLPAVAMGGTLPVLMRVLAPDQDNVGGSGSRLYAANTAGAIVGTLLAGFVLIPLLGILGSAIVAAALNAMAGLVAYRLATREGRATAGAAGAPATPDMLPVKPTRHARLALALYAVAGGVALGYEVVWSQTIAQFISTRAFAFAIVLATYLCGLMLGSALAARRADRVRDPWGMFALLIALAGVVALLQVVLLGGWLLYAQAALSDAVLAATGSLLASVCASFGLAALTIVFVPTLLLGAAFPFVLRVSVDSRRVGAGVGRVLAFNTAGGIVGTALAGFVLVPRLGVVQALALLAVAGCLVAVIAAAGSTVRPLARWSVALLAVATVGGAAFAPADRLAALLTQARGGDLVFYEEGRGATVAVVEQGSGGNRFRRLYIQGVSNSGDTMTSLRYMRLQALLPLLIHREQPRSVLVIGLGTGITAGATLAYPGLERRVVAELLPAVKRAVPRFTGNFNVAADARVDIRLRDGRRELLQGEQTYDVITLEPPPPSAAGVVNLYSTEFYRLAARRLARNGLVAQWLPLPTQNEADTRALVRSFLDAFPYATLWTTELHEMMLVGSPAPIELDAARIQARFADPGVVNALRDVGVASPAALLATWVTDRKGLDAFAADAPPVTDDRPRIEYASWVRRAEFPPTLSHLLALQTEPPVTGADATLLAAMRGERETLHAFYAAGLDAYHGDRESWVAHLGQALRADPDNPYYTWFSGAGRRAPAGATNAPAAASASTATTTTTTTTTPTTTTTTATSTATSANGATSATTATSATRAQP